MSNYYRCSHCRGFYETDRERCKYCRYTTKVAGVDGSPRVFADRAACRVIQIAEYERLPAEAMEDPIWPPSDELDEMCGCLHCGPDGPPFEAVEMRWMTNEQMWACPCTTCGGRGFDFDIHPLAARWECCECGKKWRPPDDNFKPSNCQCPVCGCRCANGWFDDEYSQEEIEAMSEEKYKEVFGQTRAEEEAEFEEFNRKFDAEQKAKAEGTWVEPPPPDFGDEPDPETIFEPVDRVAAGEESVAEDICNYDPEKRLGEVDEEEGAAPRRGEERMRDDIDFPHEPPREKRRGAGDVPEGDIPF